MERQSRRFIAKAHIMGGGIAVRAGQIVEETQLNGYRESLERTGGLEEISAVTESHASRKRGSRRG